MEDSDLLAFAPVELRRRCDGWTARRQYLFILALAHGCKPGRAAALVGMSRKTAYELRGKPGGEGFAAAWDAAVERARERRFAGRTASLAERALHGEWRPRLYRGRLVGWTHAAAGMRGIGLLKRLDAAAERLPAGASTAHFERVMAALRAKGDNPDANSRTGRRTCHVSADDRA